MLLFKDIENHDNANGTTKDGRITVPQQTFERARNSSGYTGSISILSYAKSTLFRSSLLEGGKAQEVNSVVISVSFGRNVTVEGNPAIVLYFRKKNTTLENVNCSYWKGR